jgi:hypothetical protein
MSDGIEPKTATHEHGAVEKGAVPSSHDASAMTKNLEAK